jgi:F-type H+-transporting ATPase subunit delta
MAEERVSRVYASALFDAAKQAKAVAQVESELDTIQKLLDTDDSFRNFLVSPKRSEEEKLSLVEKVFGGKIHDLTHGIFKLMLGKRRPAEIPLIRKDFVELRLADEQNLSAHVTSTTDLTADEKKRITDALTKRMGKKIEATFSTDSSLGGGVRVAYGDFILDGSVQASFNRLKDSLQHDALKQA